MTPNPFDALGGGCDMNAAYRDARAKSEALAGDSLGPLTDGLGGGAGGGTGFPGLG